MDVDEGETPVRADLQGRGLPGDKFRETEHLVLGHILVADGGDVASLSRAGGGPRLRQPAAEEGGIPLLPKPHGHVHLVAPGCDPCLLEHDGKAPLLGQHAGDEVLLIGTGPRPPASSECVPEGPVRWDEAVAQVPGEEPESVANASSWSQLSRAGIAAWSAGGVRSPGCAGALGCGEPAPRGAHTGASPAEMDL